MEDLGNGRIKINNHIYKLWLEEKLIKAGIVEMAAWLNNKFSRTDTSPILMEVQTGGKYLLVDLHRKLNINVHIDAVGIHSYSKTGEQEELKLTCKWRSDVTGRDVVLVEDMIDTGNTTQFLKNLLLEEGAKSVTIIALISRNHSIKGEGEYDYVCFTYDGNEWLLGYGLDDNELYRELTRVYVKISG